jgi:hypothetical protein
MTTSIGTLPISPYDIKLGVLVLILRIFLQNCKCILLISILYRIMYMLSQRENVNFKWINHIKSIFDNVGLSYVWNE